MEADFPELRQVEAIAVREDQICIRDPSGISDKIIFLSPDLFFIVSLFDGKHSILDIQAEYTRRFGIILFSEKVKDIINQLDSCLFLENKHFQEVKNRKIKEFKERPTRPASHAGISYQKDPEALKKQLKEMFKNYLSSSEKGWEGEIRGLIVPHIDLTRGGGCYASGYTELYKHCNATTFVILGISHVQTTRQFVLTDKDFETPLGILPADKSFISALTKKCKYDFFEDEFVHRTEHSIEFQAVLLRYIYEQEREVKIVPVLCGSFEKFYMDGSPSEGDPEFYDFTSALGSILKERGSSICCIAGVDLSHVGKRFGQDVIMGYDLLNRVKEHDLKLIEKVLDFDAEGFLKFIQAERDCYNVCGVPAIYTLLKVIEAKKSKLILYDHSVDDKTQSVVSFMSSVHYQV